MNDNIYESALCKAAEVFRDLGLTSLRIKDEMGKYEIELKKEAPAQNVVAAPAVVPAAPAAAAPVDAAPAAPGSANGADSNVDAIKAPLVGIFYAAPAPDQPAFVRPGDRVKKGDIICIIEAMKMMNEITADCDCVIEEVCADNGVLVEFGQMLFKVKK